MAHIIYVSGNDLKFVDVIDEENLFVEAKEAWESLGQPEMWVYALLKNAPWHIDGKPLKQTKKYSKT